MPNNLCVYINVYIGRYIDMRSYFHDSFGRLRFILIFALCVFLDVCTCTKFEPSAYDNQKKLEICVLINHHVDAENQFVSTGGGGGHGKFF